MIARRERTAASQLAESSNRLLSILASSIVAGAGGWRPHASAARQRYHRLSALCRALCRRVESTQPRHPNPARHRAGVPWAKAR